MKHFAHLHVHTEFSLLDGAIKLEKLVNFAKKDGMKAIGISDHGNIFGAVKFFQLCKKTGIKPILGMEAYMAEDAQIKDASNKYFHILIIVKNQQGYKNLCKLIDYSYTKGFYFKPRIDYKILEKHSEGLIVATACMGGHIPSLLIQNREEEANKWIDWYLKRFSTENFFLEIQPEDQEEQISLNKKIWEISKNKGINVIASCDAHYLRPEDHQAHEIMLSIQTHHKITDPDRMTFGDCRAYLRNNKEILQTFSKYESAIWNTGKIADRCEFDFETGKLFFPKFEVPEKHTEETYFKKSCMDGLNELIQNKKIAENQADIYRERLAFEIAVIIKMGFMGYFLVVSDFIKWAKDNDIPVGPGRGSGAGSLVAWVLKITNVDPIKYNLLFERFLNPERISMPDFDIDFCIEGRDKVIQYVREKYGLENVCQIITFGTMMAKGVLKDVARVLGFPFEDSNAITDLIPNQLKITLKESIEAEPRLKRLIENNQQVKELFDLAFRLEGITRHASKHAAGIVISPEPITDVLPVYVPPRTNDLVTQYAMTELESLGFLKMDFLGLKNLTLIKRVTELIEKNRGIKLDPDHLELDDPKTFELFAKGDTSGVFQFESDGIREVLIKLQPQYFEDIIAINALYRPGPLGSGMVDDFIERRHGRKSIEYIFPELKTVLKDTYGVIVYQEQVMKIASCIADYTLGEADILRRAMGKKKAAEMEKQKSLFINKAKKREFNEKKAEELFDLMSYFAGYGFNKSHSTAYAMIAYQTAYLKAHYPVEFMACLISLEVSDSEKMAFYIEEARNHDICVLPPDVNSSSIYFDVTVNNQEVNNNEENKDKNNKNLAIRFGLQGIKNVGISALESIIEERKKKGPFKDLLDFCVRVDLRTCNKRTLESLICAGACDTLPGNRAQKHDELAKVLEFAIQKKKNLLTGQMGLFDVLNKDSSGKKVEEIYNYKPRDEWTDKLKLEKEKEALGVYLSARPLDLYKKQLKWFDLQKFSQIEQPNLFVQCCGLLNSIRQITTKKGDPMAFAQFEDNSGNAEIIIFPKLFMKVSQWLQDYTIFLISGTTDSGGRGCKIKVEQLVPLDLILSDGVGIENLSLNLSQTGSPENLAEILNEIKINLSSGGINLSFIINENSKKVRVNTKKKILFDDKLTKYFESKNISLKLSLERPRFKI